MLSRGHVRGLGPAPRASRTRVVQIVLNERRLPPRVAPQTMGRPARRSPSFIMPKPRRKILLVDDSEIVRETVRLTLGEQGYEVVTLDGPFGFSRALLDERPDLVLMDVSMPALRGDRLAEVAKRSALHTCPIVLFSTHPEEELKALAAECGAAGYIRKTGNADLLLREIERVIAEFHAAL